MAYNPRGALHQGPPGLAPHLFHFASGLVLPSGGEGWDKAAGLGQRRGSHASSQLRAAFTGSAASSVGTVDALVSLLFGAGEGT